jgi:hypothetical protein
MDRRVDITDVEVPQTVQFSYSVEWYEEPNLPWKYRLTRYTDSRFMQSPFKRLWLSIINSFVLVLLMASLLKKQLHGLKHEQSQYVEIGEAMTEQMFDTEEVR